MNHVIVAPWLHTFYDELPFTTSRRKSHIFRVSAKLYDCWLNPRCQKRERFLVLTSAHRVERLVSTIELCGKTQIARIEANSVARKSHRGRVEFGRPASYVGPNTQSAKT